MIKISVVSYNNQTSILPMAAVFGAEGATLGRGTDNHFVLPDPKHHVSRLQASIKSNGSRHTISNLSQANPIMVNGYEIDFEREYDLQVGDEIQIGLYLLRAEYHPPQANVDKMERTIEINHVAIAAAASAKELSLEASGTLPVENVTPKQAMRASGVPLAAVAPAKPPNEAKAAVLDQVPVTGPDSHSPAMPIISAENQALMQALLNGAGIPSVSLSSGLTPELMEMIGKLLATAIQGTVDLNALRALVKREANAEVTMVVVRNNNPLKFFSDGQTILTQMLRKKMPGFMGPVEAMQDAYQDLRAHQLGVVAGTRAAMAAVLDRINPEQLQKKQSRNRSFFDAILPARYKAKLWDSYADLFAAIRLEAQDDFQTLFGKAFLNAYEVESERIKNDGAPGG
jgi:FHA domain-containing protein